MYFFVIFVNNVFWNSIYIIKSVSNEKKKIIFPQGRFFFFAIARSLMDKHISSRRLRRAATDIDWLLWSTSVDCCILSIVGVRAVTRPSDWQHMASSIYSDAVSSTLVHFPRLQKRPSFFRIDVDPERFKKVKYIYAPSSYCIPSEKQWTWFAIIFYRIPWKYLCRVFVRFRKKSYTKNDLRIIHCSTTIFE